MKQLISDVEKLTTQELTRANEKFPLFHSSHEGYAVLLEEVQELQHDVTAIDGKYCSLVNGLWCSIKNNNPSKNDVTQIKQYAIHAAAEAIQVAAMAQKFIDSVGGVADGTDKA